MTVHSPEYVIAGSSVNMTCTVDIPSSINAPVRVNSTWTMPSGVAVNPAATLSHQLIIGNQTNYTYTLSAIVDKARSGNYSCYANLIPTSQSIIASEYMFGSETVEVGEYYFIICDHNDHLLHLTQLPSLLPLT